MRGEGVGEFHNAVADIAQGFAPSADAFFFLVVLECGIGDGDCSRFRRVSGWCGRRGGVFCSVQERGQEGKDAFVAVFLGERERFFVVCSFGSGEEQGVYAVLADFASEFSQVFLCFGFPCEKFSAFFAGDCRADAPRRFSVFDVGYIFHNRERNGERLRQARAVLRCFRIATKKTQSFVVLSAGHKYLCL